ncbi:MAG: hypothetical protein GXO75_16380 [Calditrichaeota bacterium]|nr:hypothetical protein [Calditrichota bacterium]
MKKYIFFSISFLLILCHGCNKNRNYSSLQPDTIVTSPTDIRLGTKHNTLRGVTLTWQSSETDDCIRWGYTTDYEFGEFAGERRDAYHRYLYDFTFPILKPLSQIHYSIKSAGQWRQDKVFTTSADTLSENFTFIVGGDSKVGESDDTDARWRTISNLIANEQADFFIHLGDVVRYNDYWPYWETYFEYGRNLLEKKITFYAWGNHEYGSLALYNSILPGNKKWYSFTQGNALFIFLLSEDDFTIQYDWLVEQLKNTDKEWIIVNFHRPFFTRGSHRHEMDAYRESWWKAFDDYGVDIVLSSHTHSYIRTYPLNLNISSVMVCKEYGSKNNQGRLEFVSGGLGGENSVASEDWFTAKAYSGLHYIKFNINGKKLHFDAFTSSNTLVDSLTMFSQGTSYPD